MLPLTCLAIGDCHFKTNSTLATSRMSEAILSVIEQRRPDFIVMLGDTLDRHETVNSIVLSQAIKFLHDLSSLAPTYLIIGNHDRPNNSDFLSDDHPFTALRYWDNLTVVDKAVISEIQGKKFIFVPYVPPGRFHEALGTLTEDYHNATAIFAHQEFRGAKMGAIESTEGDIWDPTDPYTISGHVHDYDELQINLLYTGTPMQHAFGDKEDKTISFFTFQGQSRYHERIDLHLPKKRMLHLTCNQLLQLNPETFDVNTEVKIVAKGTSAEIKTLMKMQIIKDLEAKKVKISYKEITEVTPLTSFLTAPGKGYYEKLSMAVANDPEILQLLHTMFGPLKIKIAGLGN